MDISTTQKEMLKDLYIKAGVAINVRLATLEICRRPLESGEFEAALISLEREAKRNGNELYKPRFTIYWDQSGQQFTAGSIGRIHSQPGHGIHQLLVDFAFTFQFESDISENEWRKRFNNAGDEVKLSFGNTITDDPSANRKVILSRINSGEVKRLLKDIPDKMYNKQEVEEMIVLHMKNLYKTLKMVL